MGILRGSGSYFKSQQDSFDSVLVEKEVVALLLLDVGGIQVLHVAPWTFWVRRGVLIIAGRGRAPSYVISSDRGGG